MVIARSWSARATSEGAHAYVHYFQETLVPALARLDGFLGASICQRARDALIDLLVVTRWVSLDAIRGFAGNEYERAVVEPEARALLVSFDDRVEHRTVVLEAARDASGRFVATEP
jgi:heme-degrading monooxygenase HmoA